MASKQVVAEAQLFSQLVSQSAANAGAIANGLKALALAHGVTLSWDPAKVLADLGAIGNAVAGTTSAEDSTTGGLRTGRSASSGGRDAQAAALYATLRTLRVAVVNAYGVAASAQVFPAGRIPRDQPAGLAAYAAQIAQALPQHAPGWTLLSPLLAPVNAAAAAQALTTQSTALKQAIATVESHDGSQTASLVGRDVSFAALHDLHKGFLHVLVGMLEATGQDELADHLTVHHHLSHPRAAVGGAAAAATGTGDKT